jgi:hypothetical protein
MLRKVGAVLVGAVVVVCVVASLQLVSGALFPLPDGVTPFDPADAEAFASYVRSLPATAWLIAFGSELLGALLGALTAGLIAREGRPWVPGIVVLLALGASVANWGSFPHPGWFIIGQLIGYPVVFLLALSIVRGRAEPKPSE